MYLVTINFFFSGEKLVGSNLVSQNKISFGMVYRLTFLLILSNFNFYNTLLMEKAAHNNYEDHDNEELNDEEAKEK